MRCRGLGHPLAGASALVLALLLTACGPTLQNLDPKSTIPETSPYAVIVLAVPRNVMLCLIPGDDDGVHFECVTPGGHIPLYSRDGWVAAKLWPRTKKQEYGIWALSIGRDGLFRMTSREESSLPVFQAPPGKVSFLGGITAKWSEDQKYVEFDEDPGKTQEQAASYLAGSYPLVTAPIVRGQLVWPYAASSCRNGPPKFVPAPIVEPAH